MLRIFRGSHAWPSGRGVTDFHHRGTCADPWASFLWRTKDEGVGCVFKSRRVHGSVSITYALNQVSVSIAAWTLFDSFSSGRRFDSSLVCPGTRPEQRDS